MLLTDNFTVEAPLDTVYETLLDLRKVTPCVPGAELVSSENGISTVGIRIKVGPISMQYRGEVQILESDPAAHRAVLQIRARELRGNGTAEARAVLQLSEEAGVTRGEAEVDVDITGRAASMGQGAIQDVASKLVGRFARNLTRMLSAPAAADAATGAAAASGAGAANGSVGSGSSTVPPPEDDALSAADLIGTVLVGRLRSPAVLGGLAAGVAVAIMLILRRPKTGGFPGGGFGGGYPTAAPFGAYPPPFFGSYPGPAYPVVFPGGFTGAPPSGASALPEP